MAGDPITVAVIGTSLRATAWEMSAALQRSSHSPIIREMLDYSCAVFTATGEMVAQDELIPAFLGAMASTMPWVIEEAARGELREGDAFMANDPYRGGTHTPDIQVFVPVMKDGELVAWCGNIAHHADLGGTNPGTEGYANRSIFEEGLRIPPIRFVEDGRSNDAVLKLIGNNIRDPESTAGDLRAQLAAARLGQRRMQELIERWGSGVLTLAMDEVLDQAERRVSAAIAARPDGRAEAEGWLDDDGIGSDPVRMVVAVEVRGDRVAVDMTGTDAQMAGGLNMSEAATKAAIFFAVKAIFDPDAPQSSAAFRRIDVELPKGSMANPDFPAAVSLRHLAVQRLADTLIQAFGKLYPDLEMAGTFVGFTSLAAGCRHPRTGTETVIQDDLGGGMGAHSAGDGLDTVDVFLSNVAMLPAEICELQYPVRIVTTELIPDSAGAGEYRGGLGMRRVYEFLDDADGVFYTEQSRDEFAPRGVRGGLPGTPARLRLERADGSSLDITKTRQLVHRGDRLVVETGAGGGYGDPRKRQRSAVLRDLQEEKISERSAREVYGVDRDAAIQTKETVSEAG
jgi:N-methylhydantoinase B